MPIRPKRRPNRPAISDRDLVKSGDYKALFNKKRKSGYLDSSIIEDIIFAGKGNLLAKNISRFDPKTYTRIANLMLKGDEAEILVLIKNLKKFEGLNHNVVVASLIENGNIPILLDNFRKFDKLSFLEKIKFIDELVRRGNSENIDLYSSKIPETQHSEIKFGANQNGKSRTGHVTHRSILESDANDSPILVVDTTLIVTPMQFHFTSQRPEEIIEAIRKELEIITSRPKSERSKLFHELDGELRHDPTSLLEGTLKVETPRVPPPAR